MLVAPVFPGHTMPVLLLRSRYDHEFVPAVLEVLPHLRYQPAVMAGCAVRASGWQTFIFKLMRR